MPGRSSPRTRPQRFWQPTRGLGSGASGAALQSMIAAWQKAGAAHGELLDGYAQGYGKAAKHYTTTDENAADNINVAAPDR